MSERMSHVTSISSENLRIARYAFDSDVPHLRTNLSPKSDSKRTARDQTTQISFSSRYVGRPELFLTLHRQKSPTKSTELCTKAQIFLPLIASGRFPMIDQISPMATNARSSAREVALRCSRLTGFVAAILVISPLS